jgi:hypothetical protein
MPVRRYLTRRWCWRSHARPGVGQPPLAGHGRAARASGSGRPAGGAGDQEVQAVQASAPAPEQAPHVRARAAPLGPGERCRPAGAVVVHLEPHASGPGERRHDAVPGREVGPPVAAEVVVAPPSDGDGRAEVGCHVEMHPARPGPPERARRVEHSHGGAQIGSVAGAVAIVEVPGDLVDEHEAAGAPVVAPANRAGANPAAQQRRHRGSAPAAQLAPSHLADPVAAAEHATVRRLLAQGAGRAGQAAPHDLAHRPVPVVEDAGRSMGGGGRDGERREQGSEQQGGSHGRPPWRTPVVAT